MKEKPKNNIQEVLLKVMSGKRVIRQEDLIEQTEPFLLNQRSSEPKYAIKRTVKRMIEDDIIAKYETERSSFLSLTKKGKQKMRSIVFSSEQHLIPTVWDGYWRIVIVDIPDTQKKEQDAMRYLLKKAQFIQMKNSIWISPYSLEHIMIEIRNDMGLENDILIFVTNKLDPKTEEQLIKKFIQKKEE